MTRPLTGLTGLAGYQVLVDENSQATPEQRMGNPVDPAHARYLAQDNIRRGMEIGEPRGPYGPENQMVGDEYWFMEAGGYPAEDPLYDHTPNTHAGPWLKGVQSGTVGDIGPDATANKLAQSAQLHAMGTNGRAQGQYTRADALNDNWEEIDQLNPGHTELQTLPKQAMSSGFMFGTRDRTQSMARQNEYGFDTSHQHRRWANNGIPGNTMWLRPGGRPLAKSLAGPARPAIGPNSPFTGDDLGQAFSINGAILQNVPSEYVAPPSPNLSPTPAPFDNNSYVEWY